MSNHNPIEPSRIKLASKTRPPLDNDTYTITVTQTLKGNEKLDKSKIKDAHFDFSCEAEPLKLSPDQVYSVYPPQDSFGRFEHVIPHMVLRRRTLPWERRSPIEKQVGKKLPWLTLLMFDETEDAQLKSLTQGEAFSGGEGIYCPVKVVDPDESCTVLDMSAPLFCAVCPSWEELPLMAHSRCVSRDNKVTEADFVDEWLSVLVANRLPCSNTSETGMKNTVCLATIEAFSDFLTDAALRHEIARHGEYRTVRIPVLSSWGFYSRREDYNFKTVFEGLDAGVLEPPIPKTAPEEAVRLLQRGFVPLNHSLRDGGRTVSWYHGPLSPFEPRQTSKTPQYYPDARSVYEPEMGMFDVGYSAAFNLGRILGLRSGSFASALDRWRQENIRSIVSRRNRNMIASQLQAADADMGQERLASMMQDIVADMLIQYGKGGGGNEPELDSGR